MLVILEWQKLPFSIIKLLAKRSNGACYGALCHCKVFATSILLVISIVIGALAKFYLTTISS